MLERSSQRRLLLAFLALGMFFCYAHRGSLSAAAPFMMKDLHMNAAAMGVLLSAFSWSYSVAQIPAGLLIDRWGFARVYALGFALWAGATVLTGVVSTVLGIAVARMLIGLGQGAIFPASSRAVSVCFPARERGGVTGVYIAGNRLGQAAIVAIGPLVIAGHGWRVFFMVAGAAGIVWLLPWLVMGPRWEAGATAEAVRPRTRGSLRLLLDRQMAGVFLGFFAYDYVWFLYLTWMPGYLMLERKFTPREMAIYSSVPLVIVSLVILVAGVAGDWLIRRGMHEVAARRLLIIIGMAIALFIVPAALVRDNLTSAILLGISLAGLGIVSPNAWAMTQSVVPKEVVATATGFQNLGGNLGGALAPIVTGLIVDRTGSFVAGFLVAGGVLLAGIACYAGLIRVEAGDAASRRQVAT